MVGPALPAIGAPLSHFDGAGDGPSRDTSSAQTPFGAPPHASDVAAYSTLSTSTLPITLAPAGTSRAGVRRSAPMCGLSAWTIPPLEIAHTALLIGRLAGLMPVAGPRPPAGGGVKPPRPGTADCASGVGRAIVVRPPAHATVLFCGATPELRR